jgi:hypothetical protein
LILKNLISPKILIEPIRLYLIFLILFGILFFIFEKRISQYLIFFQERTRPILLIPCLILIFILIYKIGPDTLPPFIYFNF